MTDSNQTTTTWSKQNVPEVQATWKLHPLDRQGLRNAIRDIIYKTFDNEAETIANILYAVEHRGAPIYDLPRDGRIYAISSDGTYHLAGGQIT